MPSPAYSPDDVAAPALVFRTPERFDSLAVGGRWRSLAARFDAHQRTLDALLMGRAVYRFRFPLTAHFYPRRQAGAGEVIVQPFGPPVIGRGETFGAALDDWQERFHIQFQILLRRRHWEMTPDEADR